MSCDPALNRAGVMEAFLLGCAVPVPKVVAFLEGGGAGGRASAGRTDHNGSGQRDVHTESRRSRRAADDQYRVGFIDRLHRDWGGAAIEVAIAVVADGDVVITGAKAADHSRTGLGGGIEYDIRRKRRSAIQKIHYSSWRNVIRRIHRGG